MKSVLVLAAHPDDETLGVGGTISRLKKEGYYVRLLTFTNGEGSRGTFFENRNLKLEEVSKALNIDSYHFADFPDNAMDSIPLLSLSKFIEEHKEINPDIIFTHNKDDLNIDHQLVYQATLTAFRPQCGKSQSIYSYYVPSATDFNPDNTFNGNNIYFKLDKSDLDSKISALKIYDAEMRDYPHTRSYTNVKNLTKIWGSEVGASYAEKFKTVRQVI